MRVRIVQLSTSFLESLPEDEVVDVQSMVGEILVVCEIDDYGCPWVEKIWAGPEKGQCMSHALALNSSEMEVLDDD